MLVACFVIKLFGGNWFEVVCTNEHFSNFCNYIENNYAVYNILSAIVYVFPQIFAIFALCLLPNPKKHQVLFVIFALLVVWSSKFISRDLKSIIEMFFIFTVPVTIRLFGNESDIKKIVKKNWFLGIIGYFTIFSFQFISMVAKNVGLKLLNDNSVVTYILLLDYYIMIVLYYLYVKNYKKEE
jgi:hypothetical protein